MLSAWAVGGLFRPGSQAAGPLQWKRSFTLGTVSADEIAQHVFFSSNSLYFLKFHRLTQGSAVGCVGADGKNKWLWTLPPGVYTGLGVRPSGSVIVLLVGNGGLTINEYMEDGRLLRSVQAADGGAHTMVGDTLVSVDEDGSVQVRDFNRPGLTPRRYAKVLPRPEYPLMTPLSLHRVAMVDRMTAQIVYLDTITGSSILGRLDSPEIASSLSFYAEQMRALQAGTHRGRRVLPGDPVIIGAVGADAHQNLYCFVLPYDPKQGALLLRVVEPDTIAEKIHCSLPSRGHGRARTPNHLGVIGAELLLVYPDGEVIVYSLA